MEGHEFSGEGPNHCTCGAELPGTSHWYGVGNVPMPYWRCDCGLYFVDEGTHISIYSAEALL